MNLEYIKLYLFKASKKTIHIYVFIIILELSKTHGKRKKSLNSIINIF